MDNSILRNIKNISYVALWTMVIGILALGGFTLFQALLDGGGFSYIIEENLQFYFIYFCAFGVFMFNLRLSVTDCPLILSFNSRRRDYLTAKYVVNAVIFAALIVIRLCLDIYNGEYKAGSIIMVAAILAVIYGVVNILCIVVTKYGRVGYTIFVLVCGLAAGLLGFFVSANETGLDISFDVIGAGGIMLVAAFVFMIISMVIESRMIMKYDVKR